MSWRQFVMDLESLDADRVEDVFSRHGALAITLRDAGDDPVLEPGPGETPLWSETCITGMFDAEQDLDALQADLRESFRLEELPAWRMETLEDRTWEREWLRDFAPMQFGQRLWVVPQGSAAPDGDVIVIRLDPGMAFGTGTHATTALCLEWLDGLDLRGQRVLDLGCGSGILAIAALLCGAESVTAIDIDRQAITATLQNAESNGVADRLNTGMSISDLSGDYDVVVANILARPLIELAPQLLSLLRPRGQFALSGILAAQADAVARAYATGTDLAPAENDGGWVRLSGAKL
jgi:ribosomal protein L11 methyltransferase